MLLRAGGAGLERGYAGLSSLLRAKREPERVLAPVRGAGFLFRSNGFALRAGQRQGCFFFKLVLALVARGWFFLLVKWLCAPRGPEVGRGVSNPPSLPLDSTLPATS